MGDDGDWYGLVPYLVKESLKVQEKSQLLFALMKCR